MEIPDNTYCRFCAEPKTSDKVINFGNNEQHYNEIITKLAFLNALYVDIANSDALPKTVCFICYNSLHNAYDFLEKTKRAQDALYTLFSNKEYAKYDLSDDDKIFDYLDSLSGDDIHVKQESSIVVDLEPDKVVDSVKIELDEKVLHTDLLQADNVDQAINDSQTLNVIYPILEAALNKSDVKIYAKELTYGKKKNIKSWTDYPWLCNYCKLQFKSMDALREHAKEVHGKCYAFKCLECTRVLRKKDDFNSFISHIKYHRKCLKHYCHYCNEQTPTEEDLTLHLGTHFVKAQVACTACGEIQKNEDALRSHMQKYGTITRRRKPRRKAGAPITVEDLTCHICKNVYKNPNSLRDHIKRHSIDRKKNYTCDRCGKTFYNKGTLTTHIMSHDQIRPHICRICNRSFLFPNMLRKHVNMHSGVKPYACDQCGRRFRLQYQLKTHMIIHTDAMPYQCQYCSKRFRFKPILRCHERQHTGAKPYSCQECGMEFSNWSNYNKHMKRRHGTDTSKKKITPEGVFPFNSETGQIVQHHDEATEEWKRNIMVPSKRGKKKVTKAEQVV